MANLDEFINRALGKNVSKDKIKGALIEAQWDEKEVDAALASYADIDFPVPVPKPKPYLSARDAFIYLVMFATLYISSYNIGALLFQMVNKFFPDATQYYDFSEDMVRFAIASIIIALPIYIWLTLKTNKEIEQIPEKRNSRVRKWLTYLTLFVAACIIIGDLIALIYTFLSGELTVRFISKVVIILIITISIFWFYLGDLHKDEK